MNILLDEANKCLVCKNARCQKNCPIDTPIPQIISLYKEGKIKEAGEILFNNNPLSVICAIVCPHEDQCRGNCVKGIKGEPVHFHEIEQEISTKYLEELQLTKPKSNGKKVAVVGSGPAGMTVALELALKGYDVTIFEKNEKIGGVLTYGIPEFRLPKTYIELLEKHLKSVGVKIKINSLVGPILTIDKLFKDGYKSIFLGTGVWNPRELGIPGESFGNVHYAIDYLKSPKSYDLGNNVIVIGGGNVAMDAARSAKHYGAEKVTIAYRREIEDMPATRHEIKETMNDGVIFDTLKAPVEILDKGIVFAKTKKIPSEDGGRASVVTVENSEEIYECDTILIAAGQVPKNTIVSNNAGFELQRGGLLVTNELGETTRPGVFCAGDVAYGAATVIKAVVSAKEIAESMDNFMQA
ncbi:NAD(P)-dependent oxidoreductase [uncultured Clostridium sp.]|uniref:NAD(P)-dependent oxidoreductase n=1 Tax=uncultured Clostridium sp. TaxID=59620 RepID=UPI0025DC16AF|nr:NAD(P)-dependent oxidoreductase [uncultured Clostridium sp.]